MVKKDEKDVFDGFTLGDLGSLIGSDVPGMPKDIGSGIPEVDPEDIIKKDDDEDDSDDSENTLDDDNEDEVDEVDGIDKDDDAADDSEPEDLGEFESDVSKFFMEKMAEELGWDLNETEKFESVSDVIDYMQGIVEEASQPAFANEDVEKFNEFVLNGGNLRKFYEDTISNTLDLGDFDIDNEENQRAIIREDLRNKGISENLISKKIERYETAGVLNEEAEESLSSVETFRQKKAERLLGDQKKANQFVEQEQQKFLDDVNSYVKKLKDIRGVPISDQEKKKLIDAIFKADSTGQTQYQKIYSSNIAKNLIESAYFTLMGDAILEKMQRKEKTNAAKDLKRKLKTSKSRRTKTKDNDQDLTVSDGLRLLSDQLL